MLKFRQYIAEAGFGGSKISTGTKPQTTPSATAPATLSVKPKDSNVVPPGYKKDQTSTKMKKPVRPLVDPDVMGKGKDYIPDVAKEAIGTLSKGTKGAFGDIIGGQGLIAGSAIKLGADLSKEMLDRSSQELRGQQEAVYGSTNVDQFYKNLGMGRIPLRRPDASTLWQTVMQGLGFAKPKTP